MAPVHMGQGSKVTYKSQPGKPPSAQRLASPVNRLDLGVGQGGLIRLPAVAALPDNPPCFHHHRPHGDLPSGGGFPGQL